MAISVLATKCRFCGEEVGKPKEEQRELSINDLGGENIQHRAPSGSVMEALESFRVEDAGADEGMDLDSLAGDMETEDLGFNVSSDVSDVFKRGGEKLPQATSTDRLITVIKIAVVLGIIVAGALTIPDIIRDKMDRDAKAKLTVYVNQAPDIIRRGEPKIKALGAAAEAAEMDETPENKRILEEMLRLVVEEVRLLLNASPWSTGLLSQASQIAAQAVNLYPNPDTTRLNDEVQQDVLDYRMAYIGPSNDGRAKFRLNRPGAPVMEAGQGDLLAGRFRITAIVGKRQVKMVDEKRGNRSLVCELGFGPK
jgi:hypothetical protein